MRVWDKFVAGAHSIGRIAPDEFNGRFDVFPWPSNGFSFGTPSQIRNIGRYEPSLNELLAIIERQLAEIGPAIDFMGMRQNESLDRRFEEPDALAATESKASCQRRSSQTPGPTMW